MSHNTILIGVDEAELRAVCNLYILAELGICHGNAERRLSPRRQNCIRLSREAGDKIAPVVAH